MPKFVISPASIDAIPSTLEKYCSSGKLESISPQTKVVKAFINARDLISKFDDLDTMKAYSLQEKREVLIDLAGDRDVQDYPYNVITERHDLHYGRGAFIEAFLSGYYKAALDRDSHDLSTKRENTIYSARLVGFDTVVNIMGYAYAMAAISATDLVVCGRLIGESFFVKNRERSYLATVAICLLVKVGRANRHYISGLIQHTNLIHCDVYNDINKDAKASIEAELAILDLNCDDIALEKTGDLSVAHAVLVSDPNSKGFPTTSDLVSPEYLAFIGGGFRDAFDFDDNIEMIESEIEELMDNLNA